ncbi:MAG: NADH-quinone oxidoreductase subunit A [Desulfarculus sp.]|nr:NADH-quinone oxidoreductase subunit A [Desulfarculus sp.]
MSDQIGADYLFVLVFLLAGVAFALVPILLAFLITPRGVGLRKLISYESGMPPIGQAWIQFGVAYYLFALVFLAFDVDVLYLFPVLVAYGGFAWRDLVGLLVFVGILSLAVVYAWCKGVFEW